MESKARLKNVSFDVCDNTLDITLHLDGKPLHEVEQFYDKDLRLSLVQWREKRSLNANAYFYTLVDKLANELNVSKAYIHNLMLRKYGQLQTVDDRPVWVVLPETEEVMKNVDENESLHLRATSEVKEGKDGRMYRTYVMLKGSHELDTRDMGLLIDGVVSECHEIGIDTLTPNQIKELKERWGV